MTRFSQTIPAQVEADAGIDLRPLSMPWRLLLAILSGIMLCIPWLNPGFFWVAWVGWVPLLLALDDTRLPAAFLVGWVAGVACFAGASNWMIEFAINLKGLSYPLSLTMAVLFWCYAGISTALGCVLYRWLSLRMPGLEVLIFPLCIIASVTLYPSLFEIHFAEVQTHFLPALQGVALLGVQALDAMIMVVSVLLFLTWRNRSLVLTLSRVPNAFAVLAVAAWFVYGFASLSWWDKQISGWETRAVGLVQPNDPVSLDIPRPPEGFSIEYPEEMVATERLMRAGAQWVAWPEARYKGYFDNYSVREAYSARVRELGSALIFHDVESRWVNSVLESYNSVTMLDAKGDPGEVYRKMKRMPFGEYLPEFFRLPGIARISNLFLGDFLREVWPGDRHVYFQIGDMEVVPKICFETAFPAFVADSIGNDGAGRVLLFVSQDTWFGESTQPFQHRAMSIVRGVENRVPMMHVINNGPSVVAAPHGRVVGGAQAFSRAEVLVHMPFDPESGGSFFSRYPLLFPTLAFAALALLILLAAVRSVEARRLKTQTTRPAL
jgi:apolipoprotein N-acyltransferase